MRTLDSQTRISQQINQTIEKNQIIIHISHKVLWKYSFFLHRETSYIDEIHLINVPVREINCRCQISIDEIADINEYALELLTK
jgi:hypothetical protein